ncbi:MAG TPA: PilN domain-containing protein [Actinomycetes bacterium]|nr:PilN domain-containing protein [Actinomycetes bacterium]
MTTLTANRLATMPRVNLLPPEIAAAQRLRQLKMLLGLIVVGALVVVVLAWLYVGGQVGNAEDELTQAQTDGAQLQQEIATYAEVPQVFGEVEAAQTNLVTAMTPEIRWSFLLNDLSLTIPQTSRLKSLTFTNQAAAIQVDPNAGLNAVTTPYGEPTMGTVTFTGRSTNFDAVVSWLQTLNRSEALSDPTVTNVAENEDEETAGRFFDVESNAFLTPEAASNRYAQIETGE